MTCLCKGALCFYLSKVHLLKSAPVWAADDDCYMHTEIHVCVSLSTSMACIADHGCFIHTKGG